MKTIIEKHDDGRIDIVELVKKENGDYGVWKRHKCKDPEEVKNKRKEINPGSELILDI